MIATHVTAMWHRELSTWREHMSTSPSVFDPYVLNNVEGSMLLDVGCGHGKWGYLLKKYAESPEQQPHVVGMDVFEPHVKSLRAEGIYNDVHVGDAVSLPFEDQSFDTIIACEVLEHLTAEQGPIFISELKRVARKCFIVSTPGFPCLRGGGETLDGFNPHEAHQHIYSLKTFRTLGFTQTIGVGHLKIRPWKLAVALSSLGFYFPSLSRYLLGFWFSDGNKRQLAAE
jgi:SAM-dependent methyltransferase